MELVDVGNIETGKTPKDTYFATIEVVAELLHHNITPIILGGGQDLTYAIYKAYEKQGQIINIFAVDPRFDIGADSETNGAVNMAKVKAISGWRDKYPAFKWCADLGEGWYLPSIEELNTIYKNKDKLNPNLTDKLSDWCWSSTENSKFGAWLVYMYNGFTGNTVKYRSYHVRAVSAF